MIPTKLSASVYRCKGLIYAMNDSGRVVMLKVVGRRADVILLDDWIGCFT
jgi:hypothetical protein